MQKPGRNAPCPCGSGRKYKHCCLSRDAAVGRSAVLASRSPRVAAVNGQIQRGLGHHQRGELVEAEAIYRQVLEVDPEQADALHLLGLLAHQTGNQAMAEALMGQAIARKPGVPHFHNNLGLVLYEQGKVAAAIERFQEAIRLKPDLVEAHNNLGNAQRELGRLDDAIASLETVLRLMPSHAEAHYNLGLALVEQGRFDEARSAYQAALRLKPDLVEAHNNLGNARREQGDLVGAIASYRNTLRIRPDDADAHNNLGNVLRDQRELAEAMKENLEAVRLRPEFPEFRGNLAHVLRDQGSLVGAIDLYREALHMKPDYYEGERNLGLALQEQGNLMEAIAHYREALVVKPADAEVLANLAYQLQQTCSWFGLEEMWDRVINLVRTQPRSVVSPFTVVAMPSSGEEQLQCARNWVANRLRRMEQVRAGLGFAFRKHQREQLRIGYLSADYHEHATAYLIAELFELHDRERFEVIAYSIGRADGSAMRARLVAGCDRFVDLGAHSFVAAAQAIYEDGIDILVDLKGYTQGCRTEILALRPAPIQVNYLGYPGTMGAEFMDYVLTDRFITPEEEEANFTEAVVYLPECYQVNDRKREIAERTPTRAECGLPAEGFVYCSFNNAYKLTPGMFELWMRLLRETPGSVLWVLESNPWMAENLREEAEKRGVDPARLVFAPRVPLAEHLARHRLADLFLDTLPYNAHTTASDALWVGVPVLTCAGRTFASRVAGSLVHAVGMDEMITSTLEGYEAKALELAHQPATLRRLREQLAGQRDEAPLFASERFTRHLETAYATMWHRLPAASRLSDQ